MPLLLVVAAALMVCATNTVAKDLKPAGAETTPTILGLAIITADNAALRASPRDSSQTNATLWQGETVEIRGQKLDYLQVYDYRRERAGYVRADLARRLPSAASDAPELLTTVRFLRDVGSADVLGVGYTVAYLQAATLASLNSETGAEALDALGAFADRLSMRVSSTAVQSRAAQTMHAAHIEVAAHHGIKFTNFDRDGRVQICYDGDAYRRVLALATARNATAVQPVSPTMRARAALALTRPECMVSTLRSTEKTQINEWRAEVLSSIDANDVFQLTPSLKNRLNLRRASVWAGLAYARTRQAQVGATSSSNLAAAQASISALAALAAVDKLALSDDDYPIYNDAAMHVSASRWASLPARALNGADAADAGKTPKIKLVAASSGETCVLLIDAQNGVEKPLVKRCTYGIVWDASATMNREGNALTLAVQQQEAWREMWVFRKSASGWQTSVLPPAAVNPMLGYAEFAGWVPGGSQVLVAREAREVQPTSDEGRYQRSFEIINLDLLNTARRVSEPALLGAFQRWQDPAWKAQTVSVR